MPQMGVVFLTQDIFATEVRKAFLVASFLALILHDFDAETETLPNSGSGVSFISLSSFGGNTELT